MKKSQHGRLIRMVILNKSFIHKHMKRISSITIERKPDYDADLSFLGTFDNEPKDKFAIEHEPNNPRVFHWFNPQPGTVETKEQAQQVYERMMGYENGQWGMIGIRAKAEIQTSEGGNSWFCNDVESGGLWGIDDDSEESYLKEIEREQLDELKDVLLELGFTKEEIDKAVKEMA